MTRAGVSYSGRTFADRIPYAYARRHLIVGERCQGDGMSLWVSESTSSAVIHNVSVALGGPVAIHVASPEAIVSRIESTFPAHAGVMAVETAEPVDLDDLDPWLTRPDHDLLDLDGKGPTARLVDALLFEALSHRASDLHLHPSPDGLRVLHRLDGAVHFVRCLPHAVMSGVRSRVKIMAGMDIAEQRLPQDGRASVRIADRAIDLRVSTLPTVSGERCVLRLLDDQVRLSCIDRLGMPDDTLAMYTTLVGRTSGMVLLTGPTGSGKTTTLYATLALLASKSGDARCGGHPNIMTVEDPVEYTLASSGLPVSQTQINPRKGVTFATGLRHLLRQDPDVIMVGEIRDLETARLAVQASLTGHLVLSTLHTEDAVGAIVRLLDLGIAGYLVCASLSGALAQRLIRLTHRGCGGLGCEECHSTGFAGRTGLFELFVMNEIVRDLVSRGEPAGSIRLASRASGLRTLAEEGRRMAEAGQTTALEAARIAPGEPS